MKNVKMTRTGNILNIEVDLGVKGEVSKSGKSLVLASTEGFENVEAKESDGGMIISVGLNVIKK